MARILGPTVQVGLLEAGSAERYTLAFRRGTDPTTLPIATPGHGRLYFYFAQALVAESEGRKKVRLATEQYWYRLQAESGLMAPALFRWEYDRSDQPGQATYPRHHLQLATTLGTASNGEFDLNRLHLPTGWVTIEEVLRFLITELQVTPACGSDWPHHLASSERAFFLEFTSKRHR